MILTCNECGAGFNFDENLLKETGSKVRCSKCKSVFTAYPPSADRPENTDLAIEDDRPVTSDAESSPETTDGEGVELKNIDLEEIEGILGVDDESKGEADSIKEPGELDIDFTPEEIESETDIESALEAEKTEELDLSDMENILEKDEGLEETLSLDLSDIDNILEAEDETAEESESSEKEDSGFELDLDFDTDENKDDTSLKSTLESEKTEELDLSDFDNILEEDEKSETESVLADEPTGLDLDVDDIADEEGSGFELEETAELDLSDMDNILEAEDETATESESPREEDFDLELDFGSDNEEVASDLEPAAEPESTEELDLSDFDNILEEDEKPETESALTDEPTGLDLDVDDIADEEGSGFELEETVELDLSDMDNILEAENETATESAPPREEDFDLELDFGSDNEEVASDLEPAAESESTEELDLSDFDNILEEDEKPETEDVSSDEPIGLDLDIDDIPDEDGSDFKLDETDLTVDLDLSDIDDGIEIEGEESKTDEPAADEDLDFNLDLDFEDETEQDDKTPKEPAAEAEVSDELDFELDLDLDEDEGAGNEEPELEAELELEDIEELELSDIEDGAGAADKQTGENTNVKETEELDFNLDMDKEEYTDTDNDSLAVELGDAEEFDLSDLDSILDEKEKQPGKEVPAEEPEELELNIEGDIAAVSDDQASEMQLASTEKFDLSDIDQMIDTDEKTKPQKVESEEVELDFEIEGNAQDLMAKDDAVEEQPASSKKEKLDDTFDMGVLKDESDAEDVEDITDTKKEKPEARRKKPAGKKRLGKPMRILLILVLLIGGAVAAQGILKTMGINISVTNALREIPFVGDLLKPDVKDVGNLYMNIFQRTVTGKFVENPKIGTLFVVTGKIKNEYPHSRRFIRMTGKIFKKGKVLVKTETVYCGNVLSDSELKSLNRLAITKRLKNRFGDKRINMNVKAGQILPFMIVFPKVPNNLEEYSVQVAGSAKS